MLPTRTQILGLALVAVVVSSGLSYWVGKNHVRAERDAATRALAVVVERERGKDALIDALTASQVANDDRVAEERAYAATLERDLADSRAEAGALRRQNAGARADYARAVTVYDTTVVESERLPACETALGYCRALVAGLEQEAAGYRRALDDADAVMAVKDRVIGGLEASLSLANARAEASEEGRQALLAAAEGVARSAPSLYVGPVARVESADGGLSAPKWGVGVAVPTSVPVPLVGRVAVLASADWVPGQAVVGLKIGL